MRRDSGLLRRSAPRNDDEVMTAHRLAIRVYYEDTDFSGVVYHASYLRFMERGRTELIRDLGIDQRELFDGGLPLAFAVRSMAIEFLKPALMDDQLTVETTPMDMKGASMTVSQRVLRREEALVTAEVKIVCIGGGRARRIPDALRLKLGG
jgi:acyl-CoA thioester hydrolase